MTTITISIIIWSVTENEALYMWMMCAAAARRLTHTHINKSVHTCCIVLLLIIHIIIITMKSSTCIANTLAISIAKEWYTKVSRRNHRQVCGGVKCNWTYGSVSSVYFYIDSAVISMWACSNLSSNFARNQTLLSLCK